MQIQKLQLSDFRNYKEATVSFEDGIHLIYGGNAEGKTNLLEAVWLFTAARSFRAAKDSEMIRFGCEKTEVSAAFSAFGRVQTAEITVAEGKRKLVRLGGVLLDKTSALLGVFPCTLFSPDELHIISGAPEIRRRFIDSAISAGKPAYYGALRNYIRVWKQKNALLKKQPGKDDLTVWNMQLAHEGAALMQYRKEFFEKLTPAAEEIHREIAGKAETLSVLYAPDVTLKENKEEQENVLFDALTRRSEAEIAAGLSLVGPHRDEMRFFINDKPARLFASQGQQRTAAISLKIAQAFLIKEKTGEEPLILLDDVMGELDEKRRNCLLENMKGRQVILTATEKVPYADVSFFVKDGTVIKEA